MIYRVAIPSSLRRLFDYLPPAIPNSSLPPGTRVKVPFGNRQLVGIVLDSAPESDFPMDKLRPISEVLDQQPVLPKDILTLGQWASQYYQFPIGDALSGLLPVLLRKGEPLPSETTEHWQLTVKGKGLPESALGRAPKQKLVLNLLQTQSPRATDELMATGITRSILRTLQEKDLVEPLEIETSVVKTPDDQLLAEEPLTLRAEQAAALDYIELHGFHPFLLQGATGSGKTEVYLQAIASVLRYGRQAMVLIPEINLTPQTLQRFQQRFNCPLAVLHSGLTDHERIKAWSAAATGRARILIGTRSAIFTPMPELGIIIVDEEHDASYKQQDGFRYSARDTAVMRASMAGIPVVLGSATPSLESLYNAEKQRYRLLVLNQRPGYQVQPRWQLVDIRQSSLRAGFSEPVVAAIAETLGREEQVLVFLNRRGYAPLLMCHDCGWAAHCQHCSARMTSHLQRNRMICHHCGFLQPLPTRCPDCHSRALQFMGQGTERGEETLAALFPDTRILRIDSDTTRRKHAMANLVEKIHETGPCILVGTQMLAKGHHFPQVTLAVLLDVDSGLFSADFRATERMGQLITQVAGRAGRGDKPGKVLIQSHHCDHPLIQELTNEGYPQFARTLLAQRELAAIPPYAFMALIRAESRHATECEGFLAHARDICQNLLPASPNMRYLGPLPCAMEKRKDRFRYQLSLFADNRNQLQQLVSRLCLQLEESPQSRKVRWAVDVDPQELL